MSYYDINPAIPRAVALVLQERGISQHEVGLIIGRAQPSICNRLAGRTDFRASELAALARYLRVDPAVFFEGAW